MTFRLDSFGAWLVGVVQRVLTRQSSTPPLLLWCDPQREWRGLLEAAASAGGLELWADPDEHELLLRDRFYRTPRAPRVVWLPRAREEITWFKVFELEAEAVWEKSLLQGLREYGVVIPRDQEGELLSLLPAHAQEWFDEPRETWKELTPVTAKSTLVDDHRVLQALAGAEGEFGRLRDEARFAIFGRRAVEDFGLPDPTGQAEASWRIAATACLLCTEAADKNPHDPPGDRDKIIPPGLARDRALNLLKDWQSNVDLIPTFERWVPQADVTLGLTYWAKNLADPPGSYSSRAVEKTLFEGFAERLDRIEDIDTLTQALEEQLQIFTDRQAGFWERLARQPVLSKAEGKVGWSYLVRLAQAASLLVENAQVEGAWKTVPEALDWYGEWGWQLDQAGETLFEEWPDFPPVLHRIRARLRRGYLRATDRIGCAFSELLAHDERGLPGLPTAGEVLLQELEGEQTPTALVFLDAFRLDLGHRLAQGLNAGEPEPRARVSTAIAPVPSYTQLGMAFALPMRHNQLRVEFNAEREAFQVKAVNFEGDLTVAEQRRKWLRALWKVKKFLSIADVLDSDQLKEMRKPPRLIAVYGAELDKSGHDGQLQLTGAAEHLERYAKAIRRLREVGFDRVIVVTDHGFFHWQPDEDEVEETKPGGELLWTSRRAMVGRGLTHPTAVRLPVPQSDLEAMVPRSVNAFKTYGGLGFFHGGATLQELLIPVMVVKWPPKATKASVVLKPVGHITSQAPRVQVEAGLDSRTLFGPDKHRLARQVMIKVRNPDTGKLVFKHPEPVTIEPGGAAIIVQLEIVEPKPNLARGSALVVEVRDADDEEILTREKVELGIDIDEW
jgi:hypothetical protein